MFVPAKRLVSLPLATPITSVVVTSTALSSLKLLKFTNSSEVECNLGLGDPMMGLCIRGEVQKVSREETRLEEGIRGAKREGTMRVIAPG